MRRLVLLWLVLLVVLALAACSNKKDDDQQDEGEEDSRLGLFDWDRNPDSIIVRLDSQASADDTVFLLNSIPPCTLWGDGRVVWVTRAQGGTREVLEARVKDSTMRAFVEGIINRGFYDWRDELVPPSTSASVAESITISLYSEVRTVRRYSNWPQNGYQAILAECASLAEQPVLVLPRAGWVSAYEVPYNSQAPGWLWPEDAPFTLQELAFSGEARWMTGDLAAYIWERSREARTDVQVFEMINEEYHAYRLAMVVPGISRYAPEAPEGYQPETPDPNETPPVPEATEESG